MTNPTSARPSERAAIVACIDPDANTAGALTSDWVDMSKFDSLMAICMAGDVGAGGSIAFKLQEATSSTGAGAADITGKAITTLTSGDANEQSIINLRADELTIGTGRYVAAVMTTTGATSDSGALLIGFTARHAPASDNDLASVGEIV